MAAKQPINLLPKDEFESSTIGKFIKWAISVGRWVVVFTEFIVICAFLSRFYFDTELANYWEDIKQKKAMVDSALVFEDKFRAIQQKIIIVKNSLAQETKPSLLISSINALLPMDIFLTGFSIQENKLSLLGYSLSENSLNVFIKNLISHPQITNVNISNISNKKDGGPGINFSINAILKPLK